MKKELLKKIGPGFIVASTTIGAGTVVSYTNAGANYGYTLTWWVVMILVFLYLFNYGMRKYTVVTGKTLMTGIYERYGKGCAGVIGVMSLIGQCAYAVGNFMAVGLGLNMLFPFIPIKIGGCIGLAGCLIMYLLKNLYKKTEFVMKILIGIMVVIFILSFFTTVGVHNDTVTHSIVPGIPAGSFTVMLALFGTTTSLATQAWATSLTKDKGYTPEDVKGPSLVIDVLVQVISIGIVSGSCFFIGANLLGGSPIADAGQLADALAGQMGTVIRPIFGLGFTAAAFSSQIMAPKLGVNLLLEGFGKESGVENKLENIISAVILVFGAVLGCALGSAPVSLLTAAQIGGIISTPILGIFTILILNRKDEMGEYRIKPYFTVLLIIAYIMAIITIVNNLIGIISGF